MGEEAEKARKERLAAALRSNLGRRKAQARARDGVRPQAGEADGRAATDGGEEAGGEAPATGEPQP